MTRRTLLQPCYSSALRAAVVESDEPIPVL